MAEAPILALIFTACTVCILSTACLYFWKRLLAQRIRMMIRGRQLWCPFINSAGKLIAPNTLFAILPPPGFEKNRLLHILREQNESWLNVNERTRLAGHVKKYGYGEKLWILKHRFKDVHSEGGQH